MKIKARLLLLWSLLGTLVGCGQAGAPVANPPSTVQATEIAPTQALLPSVSAGVEVSPETPAPSVETPEPSAIEPEFDGARAFTDLEAQMQWVPRHTGTDGWRQTGDFIVTQLQAAGWTVEEQRFPYQGVEARNIIGRRGSGPVIILGAHYDTRRVADNDADPALRTQPVPGANDGASGVAVLLELARVLEPEQLGREIQLAFFDIEDNGELEGWEWAAGSRYMAENLTVQPAAVVIVDMVGDADLQLYYERNSTSALSESIWATAADLGFRQFIPEPRHSMLDDHTAFLEQGIPAVDIIDFDYSYWHTVEDSLDKVSDTSLAAVGTTLEVWLESGQAP